MSVGVVVIGLGVSVLLLAMGMHRINEGHVGVYFRGGKLLPGITEPGYNFMFPLITTFEEVQTTVQTDKVTDIPCGTSGGVVIVFGKIEVVNQLNQNLVWDTVKNYTTDYDKTWIFEKIHHEINQFCSSHSLQEVYIQLFDMLDESLASALQRDLNVWAPGIRIISIRVTKPKIPEQVLKGYEQIELEKTKLMIAVETQKVVEKEAETKRKERTIKAQGEAEVSKIEMERMIVEKEGQAKIQHIENEMKLGQARGQTDAEHYRQLKEIEANNAMLTPEYLKLQTIKAISNNAKLFFGTDIPTYLATNFELFNEDKQK